MADPIPGALLPRIRTRFASQLHSYPTTDTEFLQLNTPRPPFNDCACAGPSTLRSIAG